MTLKLADFGKSRLISADGKYVQKSFDGARGRYMAPESFGNEFSVKSDAWMFAVCAWEILNECKLEPFASSIDAEVNDEKAWLRKLYLGCTSKGAHFLGPGHGLDE